MLCADNSYIIMLILKIQRDNFPWFMLLQRFVVCYNLNFSKVT